MKFKIIRLRAYLLFVFCCLSSFAVAQTNEDNIKLLQGEWVWEEASISDDENPVTFDLRNDYFKFYDEIEVKGDTVFLKDSEKTQKVKYEINGNYLGIDLPLGESFIAEWVIDDNKLYLEFSSLHPNNASKEVKVLLVYNKK